MNQREAILYLLGIAGFGLALWLAWPVRESPARSDAVASHGRLRDQVGWLAALPDAGPAMAVLPPAQPSATLVNGRNGRGVDLGGKTVAAYVGERIARARSGDAQAAYEVYQAESICAANQDPVAEYQDPAEREIFLRERENLVKLCIGVSPAQVQERLGFLNTAARAGHLKAQIDFFTEGPYGHEYDMEAGATDPIVIKWKDDALSYLKQAGNQCDHFALATLSNVYDAGSLTGRDVRSSMAYAIAAAVPRNKVLTEEQLRSRFGDELNAADFDSARQLGAGLAAKACPNQI